MRVRPASDLPSFLFNSRLFLLNLISNSHDQHSIEMTELPERLWGISASTTGLTGSSR